MEWATTPAACTAHTSERRWWALASLPSDPQRLAVAHAAFEPACAIAAAVDAVGAPDDLVVRDAAATPGGLEPVAHLDALDGLDPHECAGQLRVESLVTGHV